MCERSEGVFLWVALAVKDLRRGIEEQDSLSLLHNRLFGYPSELQDFIQLAFDGIDPAYKACTGRLLLMMLENTGPPALICLPFLEDSFTADGEYIMDTRWTPKCDTDLYRLIDRAATCANKWCRDLLRPVDATEVKEEINSNNDLEYPSAELPSPPISSFYTSEPYFDHIISHLFFDHRSFHQFVEGKADVGILSDMAGQGFNYRLAWLFALVELSRCAPDLHSFDDVFWIACWFLVGSDEIHGLLDIAKDDQALADGILQCLEAFDLIGQNIKTSSEHCHWAAHRLATEGCFDQRLGGRKPAGSGYISFASYLVYFALPDFIISPIILTQRQELLTEVQKQFVQEISLIPHLYSRNRTSYTLGRPTHDCDIIIQLIRSGVDVNRPTERIDCRQDYSVWQFCLLWLHDYFHERPRARPDDFHDLCSTELSMRTIKDTATVFHTFLRHGADPFAMISSADLIECHKQDATANKPTFLSVADVVEDTRIAAERQLANHNDPHRLLTARLAAVGELEELLQEAFTQRYLSSSHATAINATTQSNTWLQS